MTCAQSGDGAFALFSSHLTKRYGRETWALRDVSLQIPAGLITALVGPNAAGKSTLIRIWSGFEKPTAGSTCVVGQDPQIRPRDAAMRLAYLSQTPSLYRDVSVSDHLKLAEHYRPSFDRASANRHLERFGIRASTLARQLSGGQTTQVSLAIALATRAPVLLLDEPMASLDPLARRDVLDLLKEESTVGGRTVLLSSHIVEDVAYAADHLVVLGKGRVLLSSRLSEALSTHVVGPRQVQDATVVAPQPGGASWLLEIPQGRAPTEGTRQATVEEVVLGYLRQGRTGDGEAISTDADGGAA